MTPHGTAEAAERLRRFRNGETEDDVWAVGECMNDDLDALADAMLAELDLSEISAEKLLADGWEQVSWGLKHKSGWYARNTKSGLSFSPPSNAVLPKCLKPETMGQVRTLARLSGSPLSEQSKQPT